MQIIPRLIRLKDAPNYLGMDRHRFNEDVRPNVTEIPIGSQGIAFDRLDLDAWVDDHKRCSGRPAANTDRSKEKWDESERRVFIKETKRGISIKRSTANDFAKALKLVTSRKLKNI